MKSIQTFAAFPQAGQRLTSSFIILATVIAFAGGATPLRAAITGFGDFSGFQINQGDGGAAPAVSIANGSISLTNQQSGEYRSVFSTTKENIGQFTFTLTYQLIGTPSSSFGLALVFQNDARGPAAVSSGGPFAYGNNNIGGKIQSSAALSLEYAFGTASSGLYFGGNVGGGSANTAPLNMFSGNPITITLSYNGIVLHEQLVDTVSGASYDADFITNIPAQVGASTAYVGFTATNGGAAATTQRFSNIQFVPEPSAIGLLAAGILAAGGLRRRSTPTSDAR